MLTSYFRILAPSISNCSSIPVTSRMVQQKSEFISIPSLKLYVLCTMTLVHKPYALHKAIFFPPADRAKGSYATEPVRFRYEQGWATWQPWALVNLPNNELTEAELRLSDTQMPSKSEHPSDAPAAGIHFKNSVHLRRSTLQPPAQFGYNRANQPCIACKSYSGS